MSTDPVNAEMINCISLARWGSEEHSVNDCGIEIGYCAEGRRIYCFNDKCEILTEGQFIICLRRSQKAPSVMLTGREQGMTLYIMGTDICLPIPGLFDGTGIFSALRECCHGGDHAVCFSQRISSVFSELMHTETADSIYKLRLTELLLMLCEAAEHDIAAAPHICTYQELEAAQRVFDYSMEHISEHISIERLAEYTGISSTRLKAGCHNVYDMPLYSFIRREKMYRAAELLKKTDRLIIDIAADMGYDNPSKFSGAFRDIMGTSPNDFRRSGLSVWSIPALQCK